MVFAGLWAALGAARRLDELAVPHGAVDITVLSSKPFHDIRVRNYEADLSACRLPLAGLLDPAGVGPVTAEVTAIDTSAATVTTSAGTTYHYDRLVLASGSQVVKPDIPDLHEFGFDVDSYDGAVARRPANCPADSTRSSPAVSIPVRPAPTATAVAAGVIHRVVLVDHNRRVGSAMGASARSVIEKALLENGIELKTGLSEQRYPNTACRSRRMR